MKDFKEVVLSVMSYGNYSMLRNSGSPASELDYFHGFEEMEKQYLAGISPDEIGRALIDSQAGVLQ